MSKIKIIHLSDTHGYHRDIRLKILLEEQISTRYTKPEVICHSGDFSSAERTKGHDYDDFLNWFSELDIANKVLVCGNHEVLVEKDLDKFDNRCRELGITHLYHSSANIEGFNFYGSPQTPEFYNWAFNVPRNDIMWHIPLDTDVLITHGPPFGIGDRCGAFKSDIVGDFKLLQEIEFVLKNGKRKSTIFTHQFGHIHSDKGIFRADEVLPYYKGINASYVNEAYNGEDTFELYTSIIENFNGDY